MVSGMQRGWSILVFLAVFLARTHLCPAVPAGVYSAPPSGKAADARTGRLSRHWWERYRARRPTPEQQMALIETLRSQGRLIRASRACLALVNAWPESPQAPQAQLTYCQLLEQRRKPDKAFEEYQVLMDVFAGYFPYDEVMDRMYAIADNKATRWRRFLFFRFQTPEEAIPMFERLIVNGAHWPQIAELQYRLGYIYEKNKQYDLAIDAYGYYFQRYPYGVLAERALYAQARCATLYANQYPLSDQLHENAAVLLQGILDSYPYSDWAAEARSRLDEQQACLAASLLRQAALYDKTAFWTRNAAAKRRAYEAARICYGRVVDEFPSRREADRARARSRAINRYLERQP